MLCLSCHLISGPYDVLGLNCQLLGKSVKMNAGVRQIKILVIKIMRRKRK